MGVHREHNDSVNLLLLKIARILTTSNPTRAGYHSPTASSGSTFSSPSLFTPSTLSLLSIFWPSIDGVAKSAQPSH